MAARLGVRFTSSMVPTLLILLLILASPSEVLAKKKSKQQKSDQKSPPASTPTPPTPSFSSKNDESPTTTPSVIDVLFVTMSSDSSFCDSTRYYMDPNFEHLLPDHLEFRANLICMNDLPLYLRYSAWTYFPLFVHLLKDSHGFDWLVTLYPFSEQLHVPMIPPVDSAAIKAETSRPPPMTDPTPTAAASLCAKIRIAIEGYDPKKDMIYIGSPTWDTEMSIRHHYQLEKWAYPVPASNIIFSYALVKATVDKMKKDGAEHQTDFHIDGEYELAKYFKERFSLELSPLPPACYVPLKDVDSKDVVKEKMPPPIPPSEDVAAAEENAPQEEEPDKPIVEEETDGLRGHLVKNFTVDHLVFAVKTAEQYHESRVKVVKQTWAPNAKHILFYSNASDPQIPTIHKGIPNTERGHCGKFMGILNHLYKKYVKRKADKAEDEEGKKKKAVPNIQFFAIVDDDTLVSVPRLVQLINGFDPEVPVCIGERYGYGFNPFNENAGYAYPTGGSGIVLTRAALIALAQCTRCKCGADHDPDDMMLGLWLTRYLGHEIYHHPGFHQSVPRSYSPETLAIVPPITFHSCHPQYGCDSESLFKEHLKA